MWLFLASLVMFLASLVSGYVLLRAGSEAWPTPWVRNGIGALDDPWFRLLCLLVAAGTSGAAAAAGRTASRGYALSPAGRGVCRAVFVRADHRSGPGVCVPGHGPASHIAPATWLALNGGAGRPGCCESARRWS